LDASGEKKTDRHAVVEDVYGKSLDLQNIQKVGNSLVVVVGASGTALKPKPGISGAMTK